MTCELLGDNFKLYFDTAADFDSPTWVEQKSIGDLGFDPNNEDVEIPKRTGHKHHQKGRADWTLSFTSNYKKTNTFHMAVRDAIRTGAAIHLAIADGPIGTSGTSVWHAWWKLSGPLDAALDSPASMEVEGMVHCENGEYEDEDPTTYDVS